jgi:putative acyl-CoA dehydrogenase
MATYTRLDCANGSAGLMRQALSQALHHASHRRAFGTRLVDQPLMRNVLADMALEAEAHTALAMRVAGTFDRQHDERENELRRLVTPVAKYWICKRCPPFVFEAMEVLGGNGYVEEGPMPRLYRQAPLNSIWEGAGNVMPRRLASAAQASAGDRGIASVAPALGRSPTLTRFVDRLQRDLAHHEGQEADSRRLVERIALVLQAAILLEHAPEEIARAFCASRLEGDWGHAFGTLPAGTDLGAILARAWPH